MASQAGPSYNKVTTLQTILLPVWVWLVEKSITSPGVVRVTLSIIALTLHYIT